MCWWHGVGEWGGRQPSIWCDTDLNEMQANHIPLASTGRVENLVSRLQSPSKLGISQTLSACCVPHWNQEKSGAC